jgi:hypothetical protein
VIEAAYRASPTRRARRTRADIAAIRDAIIEVIEDDPPMTVRQVFYQLVIRGVIEKTEEQYQGTVIRLMTEMRLDETLRYSWVVDESRRVRITRTYDSIEHALDQTAKFYRRSALAQSDDYVEIWVEKDALAGAMWEASAAHIFGRMLGDQVADEINRSLQQAASKGMTRTAISDLFGRHRSAGRIGEALALLMSKRLARAEVRESGGRPVEVWFGTEGV